MSESKIRRLLGPAIVVRGDDIDTDRIIPARFLKAVTFAGLEAHAFEDDRREAQARGRVHPFDDPARRGAAVLLANANFGCGSSREHAPQALARWGIRAIVAESFAEIFFGNALMLGLPCVTVSPEDMARLMAGAEDSPAAEFTVDIERKRVSCAGTTAEATLPEAARHALMSGEWDATGLLIEHYDAVEQTAARLPYIAGF